MMRWILAVGWSLLVMVPLLIVERAAAQEPARPLRVMSYNIHHGAGTDGKVDLERIAKVITDANVELVALQEVDVGTARTQQVDQAAELARLTGMHVRFGKAMDYQGGAYGQAILSKRPIEQFEVIRLPSPPDREPRIAVAATLAAADGLPQVRFVGAHLDHAHHEVRLEQARELHRVLSENAQLPTILVGDLNARPDNPTMQFLLEHWRDTSGEDAMTFPAPNPDRKIDYILFPKSQAWEVNSGHVVDEPVASDHRPVVAELRLPRKQ